MIKSSALIVGAGGQLGYELSRAAPETMQLIALDQSQLDITDQSAVLEQVNNSAGLIGLLMLLPLPL